MTHVSDLRREESSIETLATPIALEMLSPSDMETEEEVGGHDTITSLAGVNVIEKYRSALRPALSNSKLLTEDLQDPKEASHVATRLSALFRSHDAQSQLVACDDVELKEPHYEDDNEFQPPDGGYGWFVVLGAFVAIFWCAGIVKSYGVLFTALLHHFPNASASSASWIPATMTSMALLVSPFTSALCQRFNCRWVTLCGSLLTALGLASSSLAYRLETLFLTMGVITGVGMGMSSTPGILLTSRYFERHRAKANAIVLSGSAAGSFSLPLVMHFSLEKFGFRATLVFLALGMTSMVGSAALYRPVDVHARLVARRSQGQKRVAADPEKLTDMESGNNLLSKMADNLSSSNDSVLTSRFMAGTTTLQSNSEMSLGSSRELNALGRRPHLSEETGPTRDSGKSLSLRELYMHQLGSRWSVAKSRLQQHAGGHSKRQAGFNRHLSLMFSVEDLTTDAACILKDQQPRKHQHEQHVHGLDRIGGPRTLNRSHSSATNNDTHSPHLARVRRPRYVSEGHDDHEQPSRRFHLVVISDPLIDKEAGDQQEEDKESSKTSCNEESSKSVVDLSLQWLRKLGLFIHELFDLSLLKESIFWLLVLSVLCMACGVPHVLFFLPSHTERLALTASSASILSVAAIFDLVGRLIISLILDLRLVPHHLMFSLVILVCGSSIFLIPLANSFASLAILVSCMSVGFGTCFLMVPLLLAEYFGVQRIASAYGMLRFLQAGANLLGPAVAGHLWEATGNLDASFALMGAIVALGAIFPILHPVALRNTNNNDTNNNPNNNNDTNNNPNNNNNDNTNNTNDGNNTNNNDGNNTNNNDTNTNNNNDDNDDDE